PGTRPSQLIARLEGVSPGPDPRSAARPRLYFITGGTGARLDTFRLVESVAEQIEIVVLDYPTIDPEKIAPIGFDAIVDHFVAQIRASSGDGQPVRLLGFSLGGLLAFETARRLA